MTVEKDVEAAVHKTIEKFKKLDVLVPCAGILYRGSIEAIKMEEYDELMNVNMRSVLLIIKLATPHLIATKGNVVNVSSVTGLRAVSIFYILKEQIFSNLFKYSFQVCCRIVLARQRSIN